MKIKKTAANAVFLGEGIFTMGYSKNYIMYWGVFTVIIISCFHGEVCTNVKKLINCFYTVYTVLKSHFLQQV